MSDLDPFAVVAIACAVVAAVILVWFLVKRPELGMSTKVMLLLGLGVFPLGSAASGNVGGFEASKERHFCGSCHVMKPWTEDSDNPHSTSLAARHARNEFFGSYNCYACHADYGMFGTIATKLGGMRHVYMYVFAGYRKMPIEQALEEITIRNPYPNSNCMQCHSTTATAWLEQEDHSRELEEIRTGKVSCASEGCHGPAHPYAKGGRK